MITPTKKNIFETEKQKAEALQNQLQAYNTQLDQQKRDKQALLQKTQNDEAVYQQQLAAARAEQAAIEQISAGGGNEVAEGSVNAGDIVGYMIDGRSACSSGTHLHFEVHDSGGNVQNPAGYLSSHDVIWENSPDGSFSFTGSWSWPLSDPIRIEQGYGMTYWARTGWYGGNPHTGIDMFSDSSSSVHAVNPGKLFRGSIACGGGQLLFARVDQNDGTQAYYLHIYH
jgi:murein DD-endopeptidase MepM/ murein hydrolase activator NlpD